MDTVQLTPLVHGRQLSLRKEEKERDTRSHSQIGVGVWEHRCRVARRIARNVLEGSAYVGDRITGWDEKTLWSRVSVINPIRSTTGKQTRVRQ